MITGICCALESCFLFSHACAFNLEGNKLNGTIPSELGLLPNLQMLLLGKITSYNIYTNTLTLLLFHLNFVVFVDSPLYSAYNDLEGAIPKEIGDLGNLIALDLSKCKYATYFHH